jgi:hypothetical protein
MAAVSRSSAGCSTAISGWVRRQAISSKAIWEWPSSPIPYSRMGTHDAHIGPGVGHGHADLVEAAGDEAAEGADEGHLAVQGEARTGTDHIGLGNPHLEEAIRVFLGEELALGAFGEVGVEDHDLRDTFRPAWRGLRRRPDG